MHTAQPAHSTVEASSTDQDGAVLLTDAAESGQGFFSHLGFLDFIQIHKIITHSHRHKHTYTLMHRHLHTCAHKVEVKLSGEPRT